MQAADALRMPLAAVAFLTRIPVGRFATLDGRDVARGAALFPAVGAAAGAAVGGIAYGLAHDLPPLPAAAVAVAAGALLTGALHLDALADTADALGATSRERALAIMRDHSIGAYGATALVLDLLLKASALAALAPHSSVVASAIAAGALSHAVPVALGRALTSVRDDGAGAAFAASRVGALLAVAAAAAISCAAPDTVVLVAVAAVAFLGIAVWYRSWLGGGTGDTLGAAAELTETAILVAAAALV